MGPISSLDSPNRALSNPSNGKDSNSVREMSLMLCQLFESNGCAANSPAPYTCPFPCPCPISPTRQFGHGDGNGDGHGPILFAGSGLISQPHNEKLRKVQRAHILQSRDLVAT